MTTFSVFLEWVRNFLQYIFAEICLWNLYSFSGEIIECGDHDDMDYGMSVANAQELSEENHPPVTISEYSAVYSEDCLTDHSSSLTPGHDQSRDKSGQLPDKPVQGFNKSPESNDSESQFAVHKERIQDSSEGSLSRDTIIQSVRTVFQEWCTQSTLEYLSLSPKNDNESVFPEANGKHFKLLYLVSEIYRGYDGEG